MIKYNGMSPVIYTDCQLFGLYQQGCVLIPECGILTDQYEPSTFTMSQISILGVTDAFLNIPAPSEKLGNCDTTLQKDVSRILPSLHNDSVPPRCCL